MRGAFDFKKLKGVDKLMVKIFLWVLKSKKVEKLSKDDQGFIASCEKPTDLVDRNTIKPIIEVIK